MLTPQEVYDQKICPGGVLDTNRVFYWSWDTDTDTCSSTFTIVVDSPFCVESVIVPTIINVMRNTDHFIGWNYDAIECDMAFTDETWLL